ncbi:MAG: YihA family ribosome biosis GTP-binding protein [Verrucomicrobia bacterium]|nr:YihA family ribosome biosis GTP-binding protein [Verrucomicrobiota bacterium]
MKINSADFEVSSPDLKSCPRLAMPVFSFIGRSNVGKSSLINRLVERRELAKVSDKPGKTKLINFFLINKNWRLVDLPGYGYAAVGEKRRLGFNEAVADFLSGREHLRRIFVLIDSRLSPQAIDLEFLRWLETCRAPYALVFTKSDKQSALQTATRIGEFKKAVGEWRSEMPEILTSSAKTGFGRGAILESISEALKKK